MDTERFDRLARLVGATGSRRRTLAALGAAALGGGAGSLLAPAAGGAKKKCEPCTKKKNGKCRLRDGVCPGNCTICVSLADGGTACADKRFTICRECSSNADCPSDHPECVTSSTSLPVKKTSQICGKVGQGFCSKIVPCS